MASVKIGKRRGLAAAAVGAAGLMMATAPAYACTTFGEYTSIVSSGPPGAQVIVRTSGTGLYSTDLFMMKSIYQSQQSVPSSQSGNNCHHIGRSIGSKSVKPTTRTHSGLGHISGAIGHIRADAIPGKRLYICFVANAHKPYNASGSTTDYLIN